MKGCMREAFYAALHGQLWGVAMILGHHLGPEAFAESSAAMVAAELAPNSPLHVAALTLVGKPEAAFADSLGALAANQVHGTAMSASWGAHTPGYQSKRPVMDAHSLAR